MQENEISEKLSTLIFSGEYESGSNLVERKLADRLGVSRIPMREALTRMVAQGSLEGGRKGEGVRIRRYTVEEIRQLFEYRAVIECGVARSAATSATEPDILRLELVCQGMEDLLEKEDFEKWSSLDVKFHEAMAEASHNDRFELSLKSLLRECFFVFYVLSRQKSRSEFSEEEFVLHKRQVISEHRAIVECIKSKDAQGAEAILSLTFSRSADRVIRTSIETDLESK